MNYSYNLFRVPNRNNIPTDVARGATAKNKHHIQGKTFNHCSISYRLPFCSGNPTAGSPEQLTATKQKQKPPHAITHPQSQCTQQSLMSLGGTAAKQQFPIPPFETGLSPHTMAKAWSSGSPRPPQRGGGSSSFRTSMGWCLGPEHCLNYVKKKIQARVVWAAATCTQLSGWCGEEQRGLGSLDTAGSILNRRTLVLQTCIRISALCRTINVANATSVSR